MKSFIGRYAEGYGLATLHLMPVESLIEERIGLEPIQSGTLNLQLSEPYIVRADARINPEEYDKREAVKLQRCLIKDPRSGTFHKAIITRPESHEENNQHHGAAHFEIMGVIHFCNSWNLHLGDEIEVQVEGDDSWWQSGIEGIGA